MYLESFLSFIISIIVIIIIIIIIILLHIYYYYAFIWNNLQNYFLQLEHQIEVLVHQYC